MAKNTARPLAQMPAPAKPQPKAPALPDLDRIIHERMRLGIVSALSINDSLTFNDLKRLLETTDGNISVHARKLEEAGYITCTKSFEGRMPKTVYALTDEGRKAMVKYLNHMESIIVAMKGSTEQGKE
jgi:DNA-binding transcriptional ArsR family regulator